MKALSQKFTTAVSLFAIASGLTSLASAQDARPTQPTTAQARGSATAGTTSDLGQEVMLASIDVEDRSLRHYAGQKLLNMEGAELGEIRDVIVHPQSSRIQYIVVSSGGFMGGIGNTLRLVPMESAYRGTRGNALEVNILKSAWLQVPPVSDKNYVADRFDISPAQHQEMVNRFGAPSGSPRPATVAQRDVAGLVRASVIRGKKVNVGDRKVGNIENIILDMDRGAAAALLDASGEFTGTTAKYLVPLSRLAFDNTQQNPIGTTATREEFDRARPVNFGVTENIASTPTRTADEPPLTPTGRTTPPAAAPQTSEALSDSARAIRKALNNDPVLVGERVQVMPENGKIVLSGSVRTEATKSNIENVARQTLPAGTIENRIIVENR